MNTITMSNSFGPDQAQTVCNDYQQKTKVAVSKQRINEIFVLTNWLIYTHYHNSNLIWRTVSRRVDEVIPSDHPRRVASRVIQWYGLIHET